MSPKEKAASGASEGFDQRLERIEGIAAELEQGALPLEQSLARYQEGIELLKLCQAELSGFQRRVEELSQHASSALAALDPKQGSAGGDEPQRTERA